jgi:hypothetical protein
MSSEVQRRTYAGRLRRVALTAAAVVVGAIVLSGCVVIQSESASQSNVIGNTITITTTLCASNASAAPPCNSPGVSNQYAPTVANGSAPGQIMVGYRIPAGVTAPATISTSVPSTDQNGSPITVPLTLTQSASYATGLNGILPPPAGTQWVGYISTVQNYTSSGPQSVAIAPTFTLPAGFTGQFTWRTVVGYRSPFFQNQDVSCPNGFPGAQTPIPGQSSVCVDYPDQGTANTANAMQVADLSITPPATPTVAAGGTVALNFAALFSGGNPAGGTFSTAVATTIPGVTPAATPSTFAPTTNSQTNLGVTFAVPVTTAPGTYDVSLTATVGGLSRATTGHVTVTAPKAAAANASAAKLTLSVKKTSLKIARKTGVSLTVTLSKKSAISLVGLQAKPKVSVTVRKTLLKGKKTVLLVKSAKFHKGKLTITFKGGGVTRVTTLTLS